MLYWDKLLKASRFRGASSVPKTASDTRSPFKKDFDTVCNSTVLRRLQDKAQVFPLEREDYARTRLTHSIEVLSVAGSLAVQAKKVILSDLEDYLSDEYKQQPNSIETIKSLIDDIPTILNTSALLHDMGNPPFGHLGEQIIRDWFTENLPRIAVDTNGSYVYKDNCTATDSLAYKLKGQFADDLKNFEGNAQLLRLVTKLSYVVDENGMNLSFPVLASFIKYPCSSTKINPGKLSTKKAGYYASEEKAFARINSELGLNNCRHPLAYLLEAADDIAYLSADIEDAQHKGLISVDFLEQRLLKENDPKDNAIDRVIHQIEQYRDDAIKRNYVDDVDGYIIHRLRVFIKGIMIDAMDEAFKNAYPDIMAGTFEHELIEISGVAGLAKVLRNIEKERIYYSKEIVESKTRAVTVIRKLLNEYVPAVLNYNEKDKGKDTSNNLLYQSLSLNYRFICESTNAEEKDESRILYNRLLLVTDQISGMTDTHALTVYQTITAS
ncbi:MAG: dNTP triphosphohydrolase [Lachnospiraceae bacterium]|nr:dNTP triphosphohydrolase [Lachnospiraceae bacterium]